MTTPTKYKISLNEQKGKWKVDLLSLPRLNSAVVGLRQRKRPTGWCWQRNVSLRGYEYYLLPADNEGPVFMEKRSRVIEAFADFVTLLKDREKNREYSDSD